ncbi:YcfL family protein [[Erwinia] mediterraneensis]|uniref:YcfL family protein n=1 Tax=[Erwinia] mediterraneensis TaxID=2161819 RepID=UPI0010313FFC|nr:YcfL family protein [[Erwinia] mediterraneensis]
MRLWLISLSLLLSLSACSSKKPMINTSQSLVMDSSVLSAGILTSEPTLTERDGQQRAGSVLYNQRETPVTVHYRFYWYDDKGLEIEPQEPPQQFTVPGYGSAEVVSQTGNLTASKVRLYLYL